MNCHVCGKYFSTSNKLDMLCSACDRKKGVAKTNGDCIRIMSNKELARKILFFCPTDAVFGDNKPHYAGLDGKYYLTADGAVENSLEWLNKPVEDTP